VGIRKLQQERLIGRAMVVDADVHDGNGTAAIFSGDDCVFTLSIHQFHNYPAVKPPSTVDIHLEDGVGDEEYLQRLGDACRKGMKEFKPQLVIYVAGADPYREDQLGGLSLSIGGLKARDRMVFDLARENGAAVAVTLAGGYAVRVEDTVTIHCNTAKAAAESLVRN
jgi:acetoin utilization deacetylase AcuC-like enzyme